MKERLDVLLVKQGFAPSREKAKAILMSGIVYVDGQKEDKAGTMFDPEKIKIEVRGNTLPYVSRGGLKLEKALQVFPIDLQGKTCLDIGASTGGFTDGDADIKRFSAVLRIVCSRMEPKRYLRWMSDMGSLTGSSEMIPGWSAWKRRISGICRRMRLDSR